MVLPLRVHIVQVKADQAVRVFLQLLTVIDQAKALLDVGVAGVVPLAGAMRLLQSVEQILKIVVERELLELLPVLET